MEFGGGTEEVGEHFGGEGGVVGIRLVWLGWDRVCVRVEGLALIGLGWVSFGF